ncbi:MAG TPA: Gfo/Idh/MocA family oxidoreductase [Rhodothermales bacterium]|nr:Gfo/Idh/MocA family oxidoreductase [Rhodothermales bacterium]
MPDVKTHRVGIILNGVTGRMGTNQHLMRSIVPIMQQGGIRLREGEVIMPDPVLVGRNPDKLEKLAERSGIHNWTTDLGHVLDDELYSVYFDAQTTDRRVDSVKQAIAAGKHVYCEKPTALTTAEALELYSLAEAKGVKHGVVQDKLWLPGLRKLHTLRESGFFGDILSVRGEFGYWVFEGDLLPAQRPSWNYRREDGGGVVLDMFPHWRYVLDNLFGKVEAVCSLSTTHIPQRWDEQERPYGATADDAAYAIFELEGGVIAQFNSSWAVRVRRDDLLTIQVDGTRGSAVAGLRKCFIQPYGGTPRPVWNPDVDNPHSFYADWLEVPEQQVYENAFKVQWELFLRHVVQDEPFKWTLLEGAKGVQLAEKGYESSERRAWVAIPELETVLA